MSKFVFESAKNINLGSVRELDGKPVFTQGNYLMASNGNTPVSTIGEIDGYKTAGVAGPSMGVAMGNNLDSSRIIETTQRLVAQQAAAKSNGAYIT